METSTVILKNTLNLEDTLPKARLVLGQSKLTGHIEYSDGSQSQLLVSQNHALAIGEPMVGIKMSEEEWMHLRRQIFSSGLMRICLDVEKSVDSYVAELNQVERLNDWLKVRVARARKSRKGPK